MNILIAPDKFKGTLTALEVCDAIERGLHRSVKNISVRKFPMADGGEGTLDIFIHHTKGRLREVIVHDPLMRKLKSSYAISTDGDIAFIEMARASGLGLLRQEERNPLLTTTFGTGEFILDALRQGVREIIIGIGGSATNDAALGAFCALGGKVLDVNGKLLSPTGEHLALVHQINGEDLDLKLRDVKVTAICDVTNPFYGQAGASYTYAPQKGASPEAVIELELGLQNIATIIKRQKKIDLQSIAGAGAGGGFAGGAFALLGAELQPGTKVVFSITHFEEAVRWADVVITGEGKLDQQTLQGKLVNGVAQQAIQQKKKTIAICGQVEASKQELNSFGFDFIYSLAEEAGIDRAMTDTAALLEQMIAAKAPIMLAGL